MAAKNGSCDEENEHRILLNCGFRFALLAGIFAAAASVFAKFAFSEQLILSLICEKENERTVFRPVFERFLYSSLGTQEFTSHDVFSCQNAAILLRLICGLMILICNAIMFRSFSKSLLLCSSAAEATITNTAANFSFSAFFGWLLLNETFSQTWLIGMLFIVIGLAVIHRSQGKA